MLFIIVCLLFSSSRSFLNVSCIFYFQDLGSSLLSLLWIIFQVDCLFPPHLFGLLGFYLAPCNIFLSFHLFIFLMGDAVFLSYWCLSWYIHTGVFRQLDTAGSWCWDEDLQEASLWLIFPGVWGSLLVQWFGLGAPPIGDWAKPVAWEPRSHKLHGLVKIIIIIKKGKKAAVQYQRIKKKIELER